MTAAIRPVILPARFTLSCEPHQLQRRTSDLICIFFQLSCALRMCLSTISFTRTFCDCDRNSDYILELPSFVLRLCVEAVNMNLS